MAAVIKASRPIYMAVTIGAFISGLGFAAFGAYLVYRGSSGDTEFSLFGQTFKSANVGIAAIFVAVVMIVLLVRRTLSSIDHIVTRYSKNHRNEE